MTKGKVKIELTDTQTKEKKVIEQYNTVTNAISDLIQVSTTGNLMLNNLICPIATKSLGGLMLFDSQLTESASNTNFPSNSKLVGFCLQSASDQKICGSLSASESGVIANGYRSVWTFGTNQCNGTISALSRMYNTNPLFGIISKNSNHTPMNDGSDYGSAFCFNESDSCMYLYTHSGTTFNVYKQYQPMNKYKIMDYITKRDAAMQLITTKNVANLGTDRWQKNNDGYLYTATCQGNTSGNGVFSYQRIKYSDYSFDYESTVNVTCNDLHFKKQYVPISGTKAFLVADNPRYGYIVDLIDNTNIVTVDCGENNVFDRMGNRTDWIGTCSNGNGVFRTCLNKYTGGANNERKICPAIIYPDGTITGEYVFKTVSGNDYNVNNRYSGRANLYKHINMGIQGFGSNNYTDGTSYDSFSNTLYFDSDYLGTICNLASPVVKNNTQTMKITYDLIDV